eukprot:TRINITY_DN10759_c0_g1_i1.p1 TRINITY_DN10759_c0_g1~~TRINITY_DN10759_c0_g1_i1.p1  ORF type:complete len:176 (-),score=20.11 TRINITY_DN10759_c0_g1_i1:244-771(-)
MECMSVSPLHASVPRFNLTPQLQIGTKRKEVRFQGKSAQVSVCSTSIARIPYTKKSKHKYVECKASVASDVAPATAAIYGTLLLGGGLFAYVRTGSKGSLGGGITGAALLALAYYLMKTSEKKLVAYALGFGAAFLFSSVFGIRLAATRKPFPSGLLLVISIAALGVFATAYFRG